MPEGSVSVIEKIKQRVSIVELAQKLIPNLKPLGSHFVGSIRGEKTPALTIYPKSNSWYHYAGDSTPKGRNGGDVIDLVEYVKQCSTSEAVVWLAGQYGIELKGLAEADKIFISKR